VLSGEATNTNFIVFGMTRPGLEHTIYSTRGEHANHYARQCVSKQHTTLGVNKCAFDKYLLEFTRNPLLKEIFEKLFLHHVCIKNLIYLMCEKKWFSTDMKKEFYQA
jgi:hypothetical protein